MSILREFDCGGGLIFGRSAIDFFLLVRLVIIFATPQ